MTLYRMHWKTSTGYTGCGEKAYPKEMLEAWLPNLQKEAYGVDLFHWIEPDTEAVTAAYARATVGPLVTAEAYTRAATAAYAAGDEYAAAAKVKEKG